MCWAQEHMSRETGQLPLTTTHIELPPGLAPFPQPLVMPLSFLIAEDDEFSGKLLERLLVREGHRVKVVGNGREASDLAAQGGFDVLLLDIHLPGMDGYEVIHELRERERRVGGHLPVVAITAGSNRADRERCLAAGMDNFLHKPIRIDALRSAVEHAITAPSFLARTSSELIDAPVLLAASGDDPENLKAICKEFLNGLPEYLADVHEAFDAGDCARLSRSSHRLGGMISTLSARAGAVALEIEDRASGGQVEEVRPLMAQLAAMSEALIASIRSISIESLRDKTRGRLEWQ
jgi:two-component system sensor histidine kinase/response regulator